MAAIALGDENGPDFRFEKREIRGRRLGVRARAQQGAKQD